MKFAIAYDISGSWALGAACSELYIRFGDRESVTGGRIDRDDFHQTMGPRHQSSYIDAENIGSAIKQTAEIAKSYTSCRG